MSIKQGLIGLGALGVIFVSVAYGDTLDKYHDISDDDPSWSCVDDGNHVCGPDNVEGKPAACYDDGGVIVALWPCHVVEIGNGQTDVVADPGSPDYDERLTY